MDEGLLEQTANQLVAPGKGILAADESNGTMSKRLAAVGVEPSAETRRSYRANLLSTDDYQSAVSGVILFDETIRQDMDDGSSIVESLNAIGIHPGIKVDTGAKELANHPGEKITEGLDGLRERCSEYFAMGARFAKWRAVIRIGESNLSRTGISSYYRTRGIDGRRSRRPEMLRCNCRNSRRYICCLHRARSSHSRGTTQAKHGDGGLGLFKSSNTGRSG